jgi:hypothetical protein
VVQEPVVHGRGGECLGRDRVEPGGVDVAGDRGGAAFAGGVDDPTGITMYATESNDRAVKVAFEYATPGESWDELAYEEKNRWRNIALAAAVAAGDVRAPDMSARQA